MLEFEVKIGANFVKIYPDGRRELFIVESVELDDGDWIEQYNSIPLPSGNDPVLS